jgi:hypothetical protein
MRPGKGSKPRGDFAVGVKMSPDDQPISNSCGFPAKVPGRLSPRLTALLRPRELGQLLSQQCDRFIREGTAIGDV